MVLGLLTTFTSLKAIFSCEGYTIILSLLAIDLASRKIGFSIFFTPPSLKKGNIFLLSLLDWNTIISSFTGSCPAGCGACEDLISQ